MTAQVTDISSRPDRRRLPSRKVVPLPIGGLAAPNAIEAWAGLSPRSINLICEQVGRWHDAEHGDPARHISPLRHPRPTAQLRVRAG
ncbi:MAG: hypothetical protein SYR96_31335 [Actinomycetota bacterium]|nr:hypothetical protein [Actinomycetota bacterium]